MKELTLDEYFMGRRERYSQYFEPAFKDNAQNLLDRVNRLLCSYGDCHGVRSGWRPPPVNAAVHGAKNSAHLTARAVDLEDSDNSLKNWLAGNLHFLEDCGLYMEDPASTPSWVHLQTVAPASGHRVFKP